MAEKNDDCCCHNMKGFLNFLVMWLLKKHGALTGSEIADHLAERRGKKPSPGTIYPVLKELRDKELIIDDENKKYTLTKLGVNHLQCACSFFHNLFFDVHDIFSCCKKDK